MPEDPLADDLLLKVLLAANDVGAIDRGPAEDDDLEMGEGLDPNDDLRELLGDAGLYDMLVVYLQTREVFNTIARNLAVSLALHAADAGKSATLAQLAAACDKLDRRQLSAACFDLGQLNAQGVHVLGVFQDGLHVLFDHLQTVPSEA